MTTSRMRFRSFAELNTLGTFEERFNYLKLSKVVGISTFGYDRYLNQRMYGSREWRNCRDIVITRDNGYDLGIRESLDKIYIHHMNPILADDIVQSNPDIFDPEFLICCTFKTHQAIHFGNLNQTVQDPIIRKPDDTILWVRINAK